MPTQFIDDGWAEAITRLADDEITTDETEDSIVDKYRAEEINGTELVRQIGHHLDTLHV